MSLPFIGGESAPDPRREWWSLRLRRDPDGGCLLEFVTPGGVHPIHAIHERLRGILERLPDGIELGYLCRVAPGRYYNVSHLIAVELCERQSRLEGVFALLPEDYVAGRVWLRLARALARLMAGEVAGGVEDARHAFQRGLEAADAPRVAEIFAWLPPEGREALRPEYLAWFERHPAAQLARWQIELPWWSDRQLLEHGTALAPHSYWGARDEASRVVAELRRRGSSSTVAARLEARLGATAAPRGMAVGHVPVPRTPRPLRIGIIGGGRIGAQLGTLWVRAGHDVRIGVRRPWRVSVNPPVAVGSVSQALSHGEVIVLATPFSALESVAESARQALAGVVVIDVTNPEDLHAPAWSTHPRRRSGAWTGSLFPGARMVRAFNTLYERALFDPTVALVPPAVPIASDDPEAVATAAQLARDAGFDPVVVGPLSASTRFDRGTPLWGTLASHSQVCAALGIEDPAPPSHEQVPTGRLVEAVLCLAMPKAELEPDFGHDFYPFGDAWRRQFAEWRLPCPEGLAELADGGGEVLIDIGGWGLIEPQGDTDLREGLRDDASTAHLPDMAPLFGRDGDLLLLDPEGRVHLWLHDDGEGTRVVARDFRTLLEAFAASIDPALL